jgi:hypothetical protein
MGEWGSRTLHKRCCGRKRCVGTLITIISRLQRSARHRRYRSRFCVTAIESRTLHSTARATWSRRRTGSLGQYSQILLFSEKRLVIVLFISFDAPLRTRFSSPPRKGFSSNRAPSILVLQSSVGGLTMTLRCTLTGPAELPMWCGFRMDTLRPSGAHRWLKAFACRAMRIRRRCSVLPTGFVDGTRDRSGRKTSVRG